MNGMMNTAQAHAHRNNLFCLLAESRLAWMGWLTVLALRCVVWCCQPPAATATCTDSSYKLVGECAVVSALMPLCPGWKTIGQKY